MYTFLKPLQRSLMLLVLLGFVAQCLDAVCAFREPQAMYCSAEGETDESGDVSGSWEKADKLPVTKVHATVFRYGSNVPFTRLKKCVFYALAFMLEHPGYAGAVTQPPE